MTAHVFKRLAGEQKTLETDIAVTAVQYQRVDQRIDNQIVLPVSRAEKVAAIIQMDLNPRILIRLVGMVLPPQAINCRVDLDGVDVLGPPLQRPADIITGTCSDYQHVREGRPAGVSIQQVWQCVSRKGLIS